MKYSQFDDRISCRNVNVDNSYYPRLETDAYMAQGTSAMVETNASMRMKALEIKYLERDRLGHLAVENQDMNGAEDLINNMEGGVSYSTVHYMQRYKILGNQDEDFSDYRTQGTL